MGPSEAELSALKVCAFCDFLMSYPSNFEEFCCFRILFCLSTIQHDLLPRKNSYLGGESMKRNALFVSCAILSLVTAPLFAGPKGTVQVRPIESGSVTIDGKFDDWNLNSYTTVARQPLYPDALDQDSTDAYGDHLVWEIDRVAGFNGTFTDDFDPESPSEFGSSVYFGYDANFLYGLAVFIDDEPNGTRDPGGLSNFLNDGLEIFIDAKGDSTDPADEANFPNFDTDFDAEDFGVTSNADDFQLTVGLNEEFENGAEQHLERGGNTDIIKEGYLDIRNDLDLSSVGGADIAAQEFSDLGAAGARNPEVLADPGTTFTGYAIEWVVPFGLVDGFEPDHNMGFELFWRDVDDPDFPDPGFGGAGIMWTDWAQNETVPSDAELGTGLFHTANWGQLEFVTAGDPCDFDGNGTIDVADIDMLSAAVSSGAGEARYDINQDGVVDASDIAAYVEGACLNTYLGDANLDGQFDSTDFVVVFTAGEYEDAAAGNSTWATGDWNGDSEFNSSDFVAAFVGGGYEVGPRAAVAAVPEPTSLGLLAFALLGLLALRRR
ncbi:MAG: hypothetical protein CMJ77_21875 [Planctomycetaceae bacterium]|nr:hypothetical protein [Planctomycetaceae bacterium]